MGRSTSYTPEIAQKILDRLSDGTPLLQICRDEGMPKRQTVHDWRKAHPEFAVQFARARELGEEALAEDTLEISDDGRNDWMERQDDGGNTIYKLNGEHIQRSKLRIETRLKLLACWNPAKYGTRLTHAGDAKNPVVISRIELVAPSLKVADDSSEA